MTGSAPARGAGLLLVVSLILAGCGTGRPPLAGPPATGTPVRPPPAGTPIKVMTWAPEGDTDVSHPGLVAVAQAFAATVNDAGGIGEHPLEVLTCDEGDDPATAAACARRAVDEDVVAVVGSFSAHSAAYLPVLEAARIPYLGGVALTDLDYRSPMSFPITGGALVRAAAATVLAGERGCARPVLVRGDRPRYDAVERVVTGAYTGPGRPAVLRLPADPGRDAELATRIAGSGDCAILATGDREGTRVLAALQRGGRPTPVVLAADLRTSSLAGYPEVAASATRVSWFPTADNAVWRRYLDAVGRDPGRDPAGEPGGDPAGRVDPAGPVEQNAWAAFVVFTQLARQLTVYDSTSLLSLLARSGTIDTEGLVPALSFRVPFPVPGLARAFNRTATFQTYRDGAPVEFRPGFQDVSVTLTSRTR